MFFGVFLCVLSRIFFNTAPRSPKVGKNVDKSLLIITVWSTFTESKTTLLFCAEENTTQNTQKTPKNTKNLLHIGCTYVQPYDHVPRRCPILQILFANQTYICQRGDALYYKLHDKLLPAIPLALQLHSSNEFSIQGSTMTVYPGIHNDIQVCI